MIANGMRRAICAGASDIVCAALGSALREEGLAQFWTVVHQAFRWRLASQERALVKFQISTKARQLICPSELSGDRGSKGVDFAGDGATKGREGGNGGDRDQSCGNRVL